MHWSGYDVTALDIEVDPQRRRFGSRKSDFALQALVECRALAALSKKFCIDFHGDHTSTCTAHSGATKAHDWMVSVLGPYGRTLGQNIARRHGQRRPTAWRCGDEELPEGSSRESKLSL